MEKQCAAGNCHVTFEAKGARKFCDEHRGAKAEKQPKARAEASDDEVMVVPIDLSERQLDRLWAGLTIEEKGFAVQTVLDYQRDQQ